MNWRKDVGKNGNDIIAAYTSEISSCITAELSDIWFSQGVYSCKQNE